MYVLELFIMRTLTFCFIHQETFCYQMILVSMEVSLYVLARSVDNALTFCFILQETFCQLILVSLDI